jgi:hypothetical protein
VKVLNRRVVLVILFVVACAAMGVYVGMTQPR